MRVALNTLFSIFILIPFLWLGILILHFSCKTSERLDPNQEPHPTAVLEKSGCLGQCPAYKITVFSDKTFLFQGFAHLPFTGEFRDTLTNEEFQNISNAISNSGFMKLDSAYMEPIMDIPSTRITTRLNNTTKNVTCNADPPVAFKHMEEALAAPAWERGWLKSRALDQAGKEFEWIIELENSDSAGQLAERFKQFELHLVKRIAPSLPYFLYRTTIPDELSVDQVREILQSDQLVKTVELNKKLKTRRQGRGDN